MIPLKLAPLKMNLLAIRLPRMIPLLFFVDSGLHFSLVDVKILLDVLMEIASLEFSGAGNVLNAILDPILIFFFGLGISGAAAATVISEYLIAFILLWKLTGNVLLMPFHFDGRKIFSYLKSGGLLIGRTVAVFLTLTLSTSMAAKQGPIHDQNISLINPSRIRFTYSLLCVKQIGLGTGITLSVILFFGFGSFSSLFTTDLEVLGVARSGILFLAGTQPVNALAFVIDGLYHGVSDYGYAAYSTMLVGLVSSMFLLVAAPELGLPGVWAGLFLFMTMRVLAGTWRLSSKNGPWSMVWYKDGGGD
ncbi:Protein DETOXIFICATION 44 [Arachis hypogaea]|nr:Protein DETOXIFICATION 44 [Arachis hypogaea]